MTDRNEQFPTPDGNSPEYPFHEAAAGADPAEHAWAATDPSGGPKQGEAGAEEAGAEPPAGDEPPADAGAIPPGASLPPGAHPFGPYPPGAFPQNARIRRRGRTRPVVAVGLVAGTLAASVALGHELWPSSSRAAAAAPSTVVPGSTGSSGNSPFGNGSSGNGVFGNGSSGGSGSSGSGSSASNSEGSGAPSDVSSIASKVDPGVVDVWTNLNYQNAQGAGTGIVLTSNGEILTNNHVIDGATSIKVTDIGNGQTYTANVVGYDSTHDVAVLQLVGASGLKTASLGNSGNVKVGTPVVAIGNAGGTGGTPSAAGGSVTAVNQSITASDELDGASENLTNLIETNADVQSGDSGGPLVTSSGQVIGMDSAASSAYSLQSASSGASQGYAIPINEALSIAQQIESGKSSSAVHVGSTAFLGVMISSPSSSSSSGSGSYGYGTYFGNGSGSDSATSGAAISSVVSGGAADQAGLAAGDVITAIDGRTVTSATDLSQDLAGDHPGQSIQITWTDSSGASHTATATLQSGPPA